jgi:hypothetical protein
MAAALKMEYEVPIDVLERQVEELDAVLMVLGDDEDSGLSIELATPRPLAIMRSIVACGRYPESGAGMEPLCIRIAHATSRATLHVTIPQAYLDTDVLQVQCAAQSTEENTRILDPTKEAIDDVGVGGECILAAIQAFQEACDHEVESTERQAAAEERSVAVFAAAGHAADSSPSLPPLKLAGPGGRWLDLSTDELAWAGLPSSARVWRAEELVDRKSVFQAFACAAHSRAEALALGSLLLRDKRVAKATHNMMAYRLVRAADGVQEADNDEDGESGAGSRMSHLLDMMGVTGAVVVVTRWYGGVLLGPKRFAHISNCARSALESSGLIPGAASRLI